MSFKPLVDLKPSTWDNSKESTVTEDKLTNVTVLSFRKRRLSSLPDCLGLLTGLVDLGIPFNHFEHLPKCIALLTNLTTLSVRGNKGMTRLPLFVTELRKLQELRIHDDEKFSIRQIPLGISELPCWSNDTKRWSDMRFTYREELTRLSTYKYDHERLTSIKNQIDEFDMCRAVNFSHNLISFLPDTISQLDCLQEINVSHNQLSTLPATLSQLTRLVKLDMSANQFESFPTVLPLMVWMNQLDISSNQITRLPNDFTRLQALEKFVVSDTQGQKSLILASFGITKMNCWANHKDLHNILLYDQGMECNAVHQAIPDKIRQYVLHEAPILNESVVLGKGGQGVVYMGSLGGREVAVKVVKLLDRESIDTIEEAVREILVTKTITHQNIIHIHGVHFQHQRISLVMDVATHCLKKLIEEQNGPLSPLHLVKFGGQIASALSYCVTQDQANPIHHCDLKTENILIVNGEAKLTDFGLALQKPRHTFHSFACRTVLGNYEQRGTVHWQGPEIFHVAAKSNHNEENIGHRGESSDVYAFGLVIWSMATGNYPFSSKLPQEISMLLNQGERPEMPSNIHATLDRLIRACWRQNYKHRPRFSDIASVLTNCAAGQLDLVTKQTLDHHLPLNYSPVEDMLRGELYEYLTEGGVHRDVARTLCQQHMHGREFLRTDPQEFIEKYKVLESDVARLNRLKTTVHQTSTREGRTVLSSSTPSEGSSMSGVGAGLLRRYESVPQLRVQALQIDSPNQVGASIPLVADSSIPKETEELIEVLRGRKGVTDSFLNVAKQDHMTWGELFALTDHDLTRSPFDMSNYQLRKITETIRMLKSYAS